MSDTQIVPDTTEELDDGQAFRAVAVGAIAGFFAMFLVVLAVCLLGGWTLAESVVVAVWPAIVGGPFFGALFGLGSVVHRRELATVHPVATRHDVAAKAA